MPFCGNCGHPLKETDFTCPICGTAQPNVAAPEPDATPIPEEEPISEVPTTEDTSETNITSTEPSSQTSDTLPIPPEQSTYNEIPSYNSISNEIPPQQSNPTQTNYNTIPPTYQGTSYSTPNTPLTKQSNGFGVAALVLGICSIAICCCYGFGLIPAIIGLILGIMQNKKSSNGIAVAGIVLSIIGILLNVVWLIYILLIILASENGAWDQFFEEFSREFSNEFSESYDYYSNSTL